MENQRCISSTSFQTDLDDEDLFDTNDGTDPARISFETKLAAHRSNRLNEHLGQIAFPDHNQSTSEKGHADHYPLACGSRSFSPEGRLKAYQRACELLDITGDWQIRTLLPTDHIVLNDRSFSFNDIRALATAIDANLESLVLHSVGLTSRSVQLLCRGVIKCVHLHLLDLSENKIGKQAFESLVNTIGELPSLLYLSLIGCGIRDSFSTALGRLCEHSSLQEINLSQNEIEDNACITIGNALKTNTSLLYLNLSWNTIRNSACVALFRGLEVNTALFELDLSWNGVNYDGSVAIHRVLMKNKTLQILNISSCNIDWINAQLIAQGLKRNTTLKTLGLAYNPLTTHGAEYLIQAMKVKSCGVSFLDVSGVTIFSTTARLAEKISQQREFKMKYDAEIPVHDILGRQHVTKEDSMRKLVHHIDRRKWRTIEYFRMLDKQNEMTLDKDNVGTNILRSGIELKREDFVNIHQRLTQEKAQPLTYKNFNDIIAQQRRRDRSLKIQEEKKARARTERNEKILLTVTEHFPDIEIVTKHQKHRRAIEKLAQPRAISAHSKF